MVKQNTCMTKLHKSNTKICHLLCQIFHTAEVTKQCSDSKIFGGEVSNDHQNDEYDTCPESAHIAGNETREDVQGSATLFGSLDDFIHMLGSGGGEHFGEFGDEYESVLNEMNVVLVA